MGEKKEKERREGRAEKENKQLGVHAEKARLCGPEPAARGAARPPPLARRSLSEPSHGTRPCVCPQ